MTSNATYSRTITVDLPDFASKAVSFSLLTTVAIDAANNEVFPRKEYSLTLDGSGTGSIALPCPDNSGSAAWAWRVSLPDGRDVTTTMAYAGTSLDLSDWLTAEATTETASTIQALVSGKADKVSGATADNLAGLDANGNLQDSGYGVIDEDGMASDSATDVPTQQSVKAYVDAQIGTVDDVTELTTTTGASTNMVRVAAAGGLEYRTTAQVLSDIGAETAGAAATVQGNLDSHTGNTSNPHSVTAAQVDAPTTGDFTGHTGNTSNPHSVTAAQVGAYTSGETDTAIDTDIGTHAALTSSVHGISVFGATLVDDADAATARGTLGLGSAAVEDASAFDAAGSAASAQAASQPVDADLTAIAGLDSSDSNFIVGSATGWVAESGATVRTSLGLGSAAVEDASAFDAAGSAAAAQAASQPVDADLTAIAGLSSADGNFIVGSATGWVAESGATALASIGAAAASHTHGAGDIDSGTLVHERGGLEADVSAYAGLVKISGGSTSAVTVTAFGESLIDDSDASTARATLGLGTMATEATGSYLAATGATTGATSSAQTFTNGVVTGAIKPASDSTTALQLQNSSGTAVVNVDTTNGRVGVGETSPDSFLHIADANDNIPQTEMLRMVVSDTTGGSSQVANFRFTLGATNDRGGKIIFGETGGGFNETQAQLSFELNKLKIEQKEAYPIYFYTNNAERLRIAGDGTVGIGTASPTAQLHVDQSSGTAAIPVLLLDQGDDDQDMIEFAGTVGVGNAIEAVGAKTLTTTHFIKCTITGVGNVYIPVGTIA